MNTEVTSFPTHRLTRKQELFVRWYVSCEVNLNGTEAARRAGYRGNDNTLASVATENLRKPAIRKEIDRRLDAATASAAVTVERVLMQLQVTYAKALEGQKYSAAVRCLELQGRYLKMFSDRIENVTTIESISTSELTNLVKEISESGNIDLSSLLAGDG